MDAGVPCVRYGDLYTYHKEFVVAAKSYLEPGTAKNYFPLRQGDVVFAASGETLEEIGKSAEVLLEGEVRCGGDTIVFRPSRQFAPGFLGYALDSYTARSAKAQMGRGFTVVHIYQSELRDLPVPTPPLAEQHRIAAFLDHETARIDELVHEQERLQVLLEEKRQAVISHAVTKGLEPSAPMKDSGVKWLGEMPAHWDTVQSRRLFSERKERASPQDIQLTVSQKYGLLPQVEFMKREGRRVVTVQRGHDILKRVHAGDFVISMRSFQGGLELAEHTGSMSSAYVPLTPIKSVHSGYFRWLFKSSSYIAALQSTSDLVRDGQAMRFENFAEVPLPVVPESEQAAIAKYLNEATTLIDELVFQAENSNRLLRERRSALISAAVTGQLDLSEWQQPKLDAVAEVA